jgi:DNA gyrase subunit A
MGKYHPHGDSSIYEALVVMSQDFKKGMPLIDGHGNFGNIEGDGAAAMRYTEARLQKVTQEAFLADLDKDVVDFVPNFDETEKEPSVLPVKIPNLLVNGSEGIAVGMATSIPPHNLGEVIDAVKAYMLNNEITTKELMRYLKGPDFPTGGIVINKDELEEIYETGTGKIKLRGKVEFQKGKAGKTNVVITEIPYTMIGANIAKFLSDVAALSETKKSESSLHRAQHNCLYGKE